MKKLAQNQIDFILPFISRSMVFMGQFRGGALRSNVFEVKDKQGNKTGAKDTITKFNCLVELPPMEGAMPVSKFCVLSFGKGEIPGAPVGIEPGDDVLVLVKGLKFDEFSKENQVFVDQMLKLPPALAAGEVYQLKGKEAKPSPVLA